MKWRDCTSYSRDDKERIPKTWSANAEWLTITVTRHIHYPPDTWVLRTVPDLLGVVALNASDLEAAKDEALRLVRSSLRGVVNAIEVQP